MSKFRPTGGERNEKSGVTWTRNELQAVLDLYLELQGKGIHESNPQIIQLGARLGRTTRSVEAQLLMYRCLDRGGEYSRSKMSTICEELWNAHVSTKDGISLSTTPGVGSECSVPAAALDERVTTQGLPETAMPMNGARNP